MAISYAKLRSGEWGIRSDQPLREGDTVTVTIKTGKLAGQTKIETVKKIVWTDGKACVAAIQKKDAPARSNSRPRECEECGDLVTPGSQCWETGMLH